MSLKLESKKNNNGTVTLRFAYTNKSRRYIATGVTIPQEDFKKGNLEKPVRSSHQNSTHLNREVGKVYAKIMDIKSGLMRGDKQPTGDLVFALYKNVEVVGVSKPSDQPLVVLLDQYLQSKGYPYNTHKLFKTLHKHLKTHIKDLSITEFTLDAWNGFRDYLSNSIGLSANTVCIRLAKLRTVIKHYQKLGFEIPIKSFPMPKEEIKQAYLSFNSLQLIRDFKPKTDSMQQIKDICLFQCYTGLRVSDLFRVQPHHLVSDGDLHHLSMKSHKTNKQMTIPLTNEAYEILQKFEFKVPNLVEQYYNRQLKSLAKLSGVSEVIEWHGFDKEGKKESKQAYLRDKITSHICSRTFFTYMQRAGYPLDQLLIMTGKSQKTVAKYYYGKSSVENVLETQRRLMG